MLKRGVNKMLRHSVSGHEIDEDKHESCEDLIADLMDHIEEGGYPEEIMEHVKELKEELESYEGVEKDDEGREVKDEDDMSDKDLERAKDDELKDGKPKLMIRIKMKPESERE